MLWICLPVYEEVISNYLQKMNQLLGMQKFNFSKASSKDLPKESGVYVIYDNRIKSVVYIGRTRNLRRRLLGDHRAGDVKGSQLRKAIGRRFSLKSEAEITDYILENCSIQFMVIKEFEETIRLEHFATAILAPVLNVRLKQ
jgi:excinuclease UvrABC nuclease subunit